ncbi:MAG: hypothetical protein EXR71_11400 [Myxococcales bacterium]|nr:hypothetical protein [Myxococcales bacterium]
MILPLVVGLVHAGLLDALSDSDRHLEACKLAAADAEENGDVSRVSGVWKACLGEATRLGYVDLETSLKAEISVGIERVAAESLRETEPHRWAQRVLEVAAQWSTADFPSDVVRRTFRSWMGTDEGRAYVDPVRAVSIVWEAPVAPRVEEVVRRYIEDAGLKWAAPGSPDTDCTVFARLDARPEGGASSAQGQLVVVRTSLQVSRVRIRARDATLKGFSVTASAESPDRTEAEDRALRSVADATAQRLLLRLLGALFER